MYGQDADTFRPKRWIMADAATLKLFRAFRRFVNLTTEFRTSSLILLLPTYLSRVHLPLYKRGK